MLHFRFESAVLFNGFDRMRRGGNDAVVLYRDDGVLVVDGRVYLRRTPDEIKGDFGDGAAVAFGLLNLFGKPGVQKQEIEMQLRTHGLSFQPPDCELFADENRCGVSQIVVPPEWGDQWRRAMAEWEWVEGASVRFEIVSFPLFQ